MTVYLFLVAAATLLSLGVKIFRNYLFRSPLDNVPGPPPASFFTGASFSPSLCNSHDANNPTGHLTQLLDRKAWKFTAHTASTYGSVSLLKGFFGVSPCILKVCVAGLTSYYPETPSANPRPGSPTCGRDQGAGVLRQIIVPFLVRVLSCPFGAPTSDPLQ